MFLAIGFVCFFAAFGFSFVEQGFAQQSLLLHEEIQPFTDEDEKSLGEALERGDLDTANLYLEKKQKYVREKAADYENKIGKMTEQVRQIKDPEIAAAIGLLVADLEAILVQLKEEIRRGDEILEKCKKESANLKGDNAPLNV